MLRAHARMITASKCLSIHSRFLSVYFDAKNVKGSLQSKLKGADVWSLNACSKVATGWVCHYMIIVLESGYVKKNRSTSTAVISRAIFACPGWARPASVSKKTTGQPTDRLSHLWAPPAMHKRGLCCQRYPSVRPSRVFCQNNYLAFWSVTAAPWLMYHT